MHLRRYRTATVEEALARARADLGPEALVLSTGLVRRRGPSGWLGAREVEVTVATDSGVSGNRLTCLESRPSPSRAEDPIAARLEAAGLDRAFAEEVASEVPRRDRRGTSVAGLKRALSSCLSGLAGGDEPYAPVEVFVGPPGAGKTTTVAKIAARERGRGGERLSVIAADGFRLGAVEQLQLYTEIIGNPFFVARTVDEVERAVAACQSPVLIDTAGRSPGDPAAQELFDVLGSHEGVRTHLVMPAGTSQREASRILDRFERAHPTRVALTKVDEAESISPLVALLRARELPVSYLGTGQRVPEDLFRATPSLLAACVLGEGAGAAEELR